MTSTPTNAQLANQIMAFLTKWNSREAEFRDWLGGVANGGPNGDGRYPLSNAAGESFLVYCPAALADTVSGPAALAATARQITEDFRDTTRGYRDSAELDRTKAELARGEAVSARDMAKVYRDDAASSLANIGTSKERAQSAAESALLARDEAVTAGNTATDARDDALIARAEAVTARDAAEAFARSLDPSAYATRVELAQELAKLVDSAPETLNTLKELAVALGNDPNFATTVTNQIASKAALIHQHGIADIVGLQTALDGKSPVHSHPYSPLGHRHSWSEIDGVPSAFPALAHRHWWSDLDGVPGAFPPTAHRHGWGDLDGVPGAFPPVAHGHSAGEISGLGPTIAAMSLVPTGLWQFDSNGNGSVNGGAQPPLQAYSSNGGPAMMSFHRAGQYAVNMGLDTDNVFRIGGWSAKADVLRLDMSGNLRVRDVTASRGDGSGVIFLNDAGDRYLYFDGGSYVMPGAQLLVGGSAVARVPGAASGGGRIFVSATQPAGMVQGDIWLQPA